MHPYIPVIITSCLRNITSILFCQGLNSFLLSHIFIQHHREKNSVNYLLEQVSKSINQTLIWYTEFLAIVNITQKPPNHSQNMAFTMGFPIQSSYQTSLLITPYISKILHVQDWILIPFGLSQGFCYNFSVNSILRPNPTEWLYYQSPIEGHN